MRERISKVDKQSTDLAKIYFEDGKRSNAIKILILPLIEFITKLTKTRNFIGSAESSFSSYLTWSKLYLLQKNK